MLARYLVRLFRQDCAFLLLRPTDDRFHSVGAQHNPAIPLSALLTPPASSPCLDTNKGISLWATESQGYLTLQLGQMNQMWGGESSELLVAKGY